eukprot:TRINITY_DN834_c0_g1_i1.p1 TRINITY_DN834_c0_g1~~TRINITY_DN834_c0_g1_i1.p1  ORF type:complete len:392 (+),score=106.34 TRINITY_DN834_c0_g1_i1:48-1223(+)
MLSSTLFSAAVQRVAFGRLSSTLAALDSKKLTVTKTASPKQKIPRENLLFGHTFSDHMLEVEWTQQNGWAAPRIVPYHAFNLDPAASVLHYAGEVFEGMKAYIDDSDRIRMFRPDRNMERMNKSADRLALPTFDKQEFLKCIKELLKVDKEWIPKGTGYSLYLRPTMIATMPVLGVSPTTQALLYVIASPVGPYYKTGFNPVSLLATTKYVRAWPGGTGFTKCGGNYAPGIKPQQEAAKSGYSQILWLYGEDHQVTEVGTMNMFVFWQRKDGKKELITAPLGDGTILEGVTRDSILNLARGWGEFEVTERTYTMSEVLSALNEGRLLEAFGAGTAAIVSPIKCINFEGKDYSIPLGPEKDSKIGPIAKRCADTIMGIQYGKIPHEWSVVVD